MNWYSGPYLLRAMNALNQPNRKRLETRPLRIPVLTVFKIAGVGTVVVGKIETGILRNGM